MYMVRSEFYIICPNCNFITPRFITSAGAANWWNEKYMKQKGSACD